MILRQFLHAAPVGISYLFGCGGKATGAVVDPVGDPEIYLRAAQELGLKINYVFDSHIHADHVSNAGILAEIADAQYLLWDGADVAVPFSGVSDGQDIQLGNVVVKILHTPGHTPEHICLLVTDRTRANEPWLVFTGHTLMIGDLGRTEIAVSAEHGAKDLFRSVQKLKKLPDYLQVFPGAYAGSACGRSLSANPVSTLGFEKRHNKAFGIESEGEFITFMTSVVPPVVPEAMRLRATNSGRKPQDG